MKGFSQEKGHRYSCKVCHKKFSDLGQLKVHERYHTGEKPKKCKKCDKNFYEQGKLKIHERIHSKSIFMYKM